MGLVSLEEFSKRVNSRGVRIHRNDFAKLGDEVVAEGNITSSSHVTILKGTIHKIVEVIVRSKDGNGLGFGRRIRIDSFPDSDFNPKRFSKKI